MHKMALKGFISPHFRTKDVNSVTICSTQIGLQPTIRQGKGFNTGERSSLSKVEGIDWSLCLFWQKVKQKGFKTLINVTMFDASKPILDVAQARSDQQMIINITGVDLIKEKANVVFHAALSAQIIKNDKKNWKGISIQPLSVNDISW